jgi:hypothetical protein
MHRKRYFLANGVGARDCRDGAYSKPRVHNAYWRHFLKCVKELTNTYAEAGEGGRSLRVKTKDVVDARTKKGQRLVRAHVAALLDSSFESRSAVSADSRLQQLTWGDIALMGCNCK